jgi:hypothetical protein
MDKSSPNIDHVPHTGNLPEGLQENPLNNFDKTSLRDAVDQGLISTPHSTEGYAEPIAEKRKRSSLLKTVGVFAAGLAVAGAGFAGYSTMNNTPKPQPVATAPGEPLPEATPSIEPSQPTPVESEAPVSGGELLSVEALEIPTGLDAEELGTMIVADRFTKWGNAGAVDSLLQESMDRNLGWDTLIPEKVSENRKIFADALYVEGWEQNTQLRTYVDGSSKANENTLKWYTSTQWNGEEKPENIEGYKVELTVDGVQEVESDDTSRTIEVAYTNHTNSDLNRGPEPETQGGIYTITLEDVNGTEKIADISVK